MKREMLIENEIMSENELNNVVGGCFAQTQEDSEFLHDLGLLDKSYSTAQTIFNYATVKAEVVYAWKKAGIRMVPYAFFENNTYSMNNEIFAHRKDAYVAAAKKLGKTDEDIKEYLHKYFNQ